MIRREVIADIKYRCNIEDVISGYVSLRRAGSNMVGLCPFHSEKSPSFTVFTAESNFYCFGCGAGGDVISFIMKAENLDYPSAVRFLGKRVGITVEDEEAEKSEVSRTRIYEMNSAAAKYFHECLCSGDNPGIKYYSEKRKFSTRLINHFGLGYAPNSFNALSTHLKKLGYTESEMKLGFLAAQSRTSGKTYDYFRNKVMIPIIDLTGNIIAFGGRVLDNSKPKYINSSDTPVFKKSRNLFAMNFAKNSCAENLLLCEGYMDVMALHEQGFTNAVATLGTSITPDHARLMKRFTKRVIICYDSDSAGQNASEKAFSLLSQVGLEARILKLDETDVKDPDEYIKKYGAKRFSKLLENTRTKFDFDFDRIIAANDISSAAGKIRAASDVVELISSFQSSVERTVYAQAAEKTLGIGAESILRDVEKLSAKNKRKTENDRSEKMLFSSAGYGDRVNLDFVKNPEAAAAEEAIIGILLCRNDLIAEAKDKESLKPESFATDFNRRVYSLILENYNDGSLDESAIYGAFSPEESGRIIRMKLKRSVLTENGSETLRLCIERLMLATRKKEIKNIDDLQKLIENKRRKK